MKTTKIWIPAYAMLAAFSLASCRQSAQKAEAEQQADSTEAVTNADTLQLVIGGEESAASNSAAPVRLKLPLDSVVIEMVNNTDITCVTGEWYTIEHRCPSSRGRTAWYMGSTILVMNSLPTHPATSPSTYSPTCTTSSKAENIASARNIVCLAKKGQALSIAILRQNKVHNDNKKTNPPSHTTARTLSGLDGCPMFGRGNRFLSISSCRDFCKG